MRYTFQNVSSDSLKDEAWSVSIDRASFRGSTRTSTFPNPVILGTVHLRGSIHDVAFDVRNQEYPNYSKKDVGERRKKEAQRLLEQGEMWSQLMVAREVYYLKEHTTSSWSVYVEIGGVEQTCWNAPRRAMDYASERLLTIWRYGLLIPRRAELSRIGRPETGRFVFQAIEVDAYGHDRMAPIARTTAPDGSWLLTPPAPAVKEARHG